MAPRSLADHLVLNRAAARYVPSRRPSRAPLEFHRTMAGYRPTPLVSLTAVARRAGVAAVYGKDESTRFGLPAFKILGASWAVRCALRDRTQAAAKLVLVAATDGNHGRAVARTARVVGCAARVYVPAGTSAVRVAAIRDEGAVVVETDGTYDDAVDLAARSLAQDEVLVADTTDDPSDRTADRIVEGYSTLFHEFAEQSAALAPFAAVFVPMGVGALAAATVRHVKSMPSERSGEGRGHHRPMVVGVEPETAGCVTASLRAGVPVLVPGPHPSVMAGLNCGAPSAVAWPDLLGGLDASCTIGDDYATEAMALLAEDRHRIGHTGAAAVGGLLRLADTGELATVVPRSRQSPVLVLLTEGPTHLADA